jgi:hypothetical protein
MWSLLCAGRSLHPLCSHSCCAPAVSGSASNFAFMSLTRLITSLFVHWMSVVVALRNLFETTYACISASHHQHWLTSLAAICFQDVFSLVNRCLHLSSPLTRKVLSLHTTVLCWAASEHNEDAISALLGLTTPPSDPYQGIRTSHILLILKYR